MEWINELLWGEGVGHSILLLSVVIALGIQLGKLKLFGISLGITMVLFVGIFLGHFGLLLTVDNGLRAVLDGVMQVAGLSLCFISDI